jgi:clan AA aspartic protease (TIGR02281 family)
MVSTATEETGNMKRLPFWLWTIGSVIFAWVLIDVGAGLGVVWTALVYTAEYAFIMRLCAMRATDMGADKERIARCVFYALSTPIIGYLALGFAKSASGNSLWSHNPPGAFRRWLADRSDFSFAVIVTLWVPVYVILNQTPPPTASLMAIEVAYCAVAGLIWMLVIKGALRLGEWTNLYRFSNASAPRPPKLAKTIGWTSAGLVSLTVVAVAAFISYSLMWGHPIPAASVADAKTSAALIVSNSVPVVLDGNRALVPLSVGSQSIYAMVDTGCSDMTVTESIANKLLAAGQATRLANTDSTLADGTHRTTRVISINTVVIGGHGLYNVPAMVNPDGAIMLLGFAVLNQVSGKFTVNTAKSTLEFD